ncbi:phosphatidate cytidylyltransferase [Haloplasma contractile]|uniref:Phosphatidate cytidylyltransferase n=1 Tax=Haloplasma contractile SSD-17B TaxID=1033810 RepID=U2FR59_9MOLU|nr:CDP-archaeol synthase [Haloplasma contractile]ERJ13474.1 Phosphatidate cytidylyltransferase protein [Haloplasma contractile SSD-17B]
MKQRTITAVLILTVLITTVLVDLNYNTPFLYILAILLALVATKEMISMKETVKQLPIEIHVFSYFAVLYLMFTNLSIEGEGRLFMIFSVLDLQFTLHSMAFLCLFVFLVMVFRERFSVNDAGFILLSVMYVGITFHALIYIYNMGLNFLLYVVLVTTLTDTFAYFVGRLIGKHKLAPKISPKKTIEGSVGGVIVSTTIASIFAYSTIMPEIQFYYIIIITFVISILAQIGDLVASSMKRRYNIKDFGTIFPGHGGVLDRLDSTLYASLAFFYVINILGYFNILIYNI